MITRSSKTCLGTVEHVIVDNTVDVNVQNFPASQDVVVTNTPTVNIAGTIGTWANGVETAIAAVAVEVLATNANRKRAIIQNTGPGIVRIGIVGVTNTT